MPSFRGELTGASSLKPRWMPSNSACGSALVLNFSWEPMKAGFQGHRALVR